MQMTFWEVLRVKSFDSWLDRFCRKHPRFEVPNLIVYIIIGNALVFLLDRFSGGTFSLLISFNRSAIFSGQIWRLVTFVFMPETYDLFFLLLSLYFYYFIGTTLERSWGSGRFTMFYIMGILFNMVTGLLTGYASMTYVNLSLFFAFATLYPNTQFMLLFFIPVKAKWLAWVDAAIFAWRVLSSLIYGPRLYALIPVVAVLNYVLFFWGEFSYILGRVKHQTSRQTVNFKAAQRKAKENKGYLHKCAVCGKTDTDHPELEFRYCSKCNGYHCYCMEHINNHVHIE